MAPLAGPRSSTSRGALARLAGATWLLGSLLGGCVLSLTAEGGQACASSDDCAQTGDPCSVVGCSEQGLCTSTALPDGIAPLQQPGDCKLVRCVGGAASTEIADTDVDDENPCTVDACEGDVPSHVARPDGDLCSIGALVGSCQAGQCDVPCNQGEACDDGLPCTADSCDEATKLCVFAPVTGPAVGVPDPAGDCLQPTCVAGLVGTAPDDADLPDDGKPCTVDTCVAGAPTFTPLGAGSEVTGCGGVCNAAGDCVGCVDADDCGVVAPCAIPACVSEVCDPGYLPANTSLTDPTPEDCQTLACTGNAPQPVVVASPTDLPVDDDPCTADVCTGTVASNPVTVGATCPTGVCNALGQCVECYLDTHCGVCESCNTTTYACEPVAEAAPGQCPAGQACFSGVCKRQTGQACTGNNQCGTNRCVDAFCCGAACGAACDACANTLTGQPNGTCAPITAGLTGGCTGGTVCCVDGSCGSSANATCVP